MAAENNEEAMPASRLLSSYLKAAEDGLAADAVMLLEVIGEEIQSVSLRMAAEPMRRLFLE